MSSGTTPALLTLLPTFRDPAGGLRRRIGGAKLDSRLNLNSALRLGWRQVVYTFSLFKHSLALAVLSSYAAGTPFSRFASAPREVDEAGVSGEGRAREGRNCLLESRRLLCDNDALKVPSCLPPSSMRRRRARAIVLLEEQRNVLKDVLRKALGAGLCSCGAGADLALKHGWSAEWRTRSLYSSTSSLLSSSSTPPPSSSTSCRDLPPRPFASFRPRRSFTNAPTHRCSTRTQLSLSSVSPRRSFTTHTINTLMRYPTLYDPVRKPRNPIVLCHGLYGFDVRGPILGVEIHYWAKVLDILRKQVDAEVVMTAVPATGSIQDRAKALHMYLDREMRGRELNLVGHSMGGLDCRHLISNIRPDTYKPLSLTTINTPHRGSPFMDWCRANIGVGTDEIISKAVSEAAASAGLSTTRPTRPPPYSLKSPLFTRTSRDEPPLENGSSRSRSSSSVPSGLSSLGGTFSSYILALLDSPAYGMLTTSYLCDVFNPRTPDDPSVKYYSIASRIHRVPFWHPLWLPKLILDAAAESSSEGGERDGSGLGLLDGELSGNDGLVSVQSARWGNFLGVMESCDHWDLRGAGAMRGAGASGSANGSKKEANDGRNAVLSSSSPSSSSEGKSKESKRTASWADVNKLVESMAGMLSKSNGSNAKTEGGPSSTSLSSRSNASSLASSSSASPSSESSPSPSAPPSTNFVISIASWITARLPKRDENRRVAAAAARDARKQLEDAADAADEKGRSGAGERRPSREADDVVEWGARDFQRLTYGSPATTMTAAMAGVSAGVPTVETMEGGYAGNSDVGGAEARSGSRKRAFDLERFWVATCRHLYQQGL